MKPHLIDNATDPGSAMEICSLLKRVDQCVRMSPTIFSQDPYREELIRLCERNRHLTGKQLFDSFRGRLDNATLQRLVSIWDAWRHVLPRKFDERRNARPSE